MSETRSFDDLNSGNSRKSSSPAPENPYKSYKPRKTPPAWRKPLMIALIVLLSGLLLATVFVFAVIGGAFGKLPDKADLMAIQNPIATEVYSADGVVIGRYYAENRTNVPYNKIHSSVINALVATEDARFFQHEGVDTRSLFRVLLKTILMGDDSAGGGSTISQQLIKNLFPRQDHGILSIPVNKIKEAVIATRLENVYTKENILGLYLNTVSFGEDVYGIGAASQRFFSKDPDKLEPQESAVLVGMLKATTSYNPRINPDKSRQRRDVVLGQMVKYGRLSAAEGEMYKKKPLEIHYSRARTEGMAHHFRQRMKEDIKEWCKQNTKLDGTPYDFYTDGLKIYTTIDSRMQNYAEQATREHLKTLQKTFDEHWQGKKPWGTATDIIENAKKQSERYKKMKAAGANTLEIDMAFRKAIPMKLFSWDKEIEKTMSPLDSIAYYLMFLNAGFVAMDPATGAIKAYVGSGDFRTFQYDHVQAKRQVGSTFKPFVYAAALETGSDPCQYYPNEIRTYVDYQNWTPQNAEEDEYGGYYSMAGALAHSLNTISVQVLFETGVDNVVALAQKAGITSSIPKLPSIALGTADLTLQEMVQSYCAFDNGGYATPPFYITAIKDKDGKTLAEFKPIYVKNRRKAMEEETARMITQMLTSVIDNGTGKRLRGATYKLSNEIAGKTGTTQMQSDGWFIGYTPDLVAGAWVGGYDKRVRFRSIALGQGANTALPIWGLFMTKLYKDPNFRVQSYRTFIRPSMEYKMNCPDFVTSPTDTISIFQETTSDTPSSTDTGGSVADNTTTDNGGSNVADNGNATTTTSTYNAPSSGTATDKTGTAGSNAPSSFKRVVVKPKGTKKTITPPSADEQQSAGEGQKATKKRGFFGKIKDILDGN